MFGVFIYFESLYDGKLKPTPERFAVMQAEIQHLQHLFEDLRTLYLADVGELKLHIVSNALLYTPQGENIQVSTKQESGNLTVSVEDNGSGIPVDILHQIFERSFRGDESRNVMRPGWGWQLPNPSWNYMVGQFTQKSMVLDLIYI